MSEPWESSPHLSDDINRNIIDSEINGGCRFAELPDGKTVKIRTKNTTYLAKKYENKQYIVGHDKFCPVWTECRIHGSTWGGSMLKVGFIGRGMRLEFSTDKHHGNIVTSEIQEVELLP